MTSEAGSLKLYFAAVVCGRQPHEIPVPDIFQMLAYVFEKALLAADFVEASSDVFERH